MKKSLAVLIIPILLNVNTLTVEATNSNGEIKINKKLIKDMRNGNYSFEDISLLSSNKEVIKSLGHPDYSKHFTSKNKRYLKNIYNINKNQKITFYYYKYKKNMDSDALLVTSLKISLKNSKISKKYLESKYKIKSINNNKHKGNLYSTYNPRTDILYSKIKNNYYIQDIKYHIADSSQNFVEQ